MSGEERADAASASRSATDHRAELLALYDRALPEVYGYLSSRCGRDRAVAEDLTSQTFVAAVQSLERGAVQVMSVAWLIGIARHKLVDHWRAAAREERNLRAVADAHSTVPASRWDVDLEPSLAEAVLHSLGAHHRIALTLRYVDELAVPRIADHLGRTVHATEALLVRARIAFRRDYEAALAAQEGS
jgi:RNA polymerase sigma-70 factor, ECF subfamily